jgi:CxxC-x17-CxxC domain-containing protein
MFSATCANCGKQCEVPFRPNGSKPVLCRDCFQNSRGSDKQRSEQRSFDRPRYNRDDNQERSASAPDYTAQLDMLNAKLDKILSFLTQKPEEPAPLESSLDEKVIEEIIDEVQEEKEAPKKKAKKTKSAPKKKK